MAHVKITQEKATGPLRIEVDGVDLTNHVYNEGFGLVQVGEGPFTEWGVRMIIAADALDIDLPDAVVEAIAKADKDMAAPEVTDVHVVGLTPHGDGCPVCAAQEKRADQ